MGIGGVKNSFSVSRVQQYDDIFPRWTFSGDLDFMFRGGFLEPTLCILVILLFGNLGKASRSLSRFSGLYPTACAKVLLVLLFFAAIFSLFFCSWAFFRASGDSQGGIDGGIFETKALAVHAPVGITEGEILLLLNCPATLLLNVTPFSTWSWSQLDS